MHLALGTVQFGLAYGISGNGAPIAPTEARAILGAAYDAGIRRLDTAPGYGNIEERLSDLCGSLDFDVVSKIPSMPTDMDSRELLSELTRSVEQSQRRLGDRLCGLILHDPQMLWGANGVLVREKLSSLVRGTRIQLGASHYSSDTIPNFGDWSDHCMMQLPGNAYDQRIDKISSDRPTVETSMRSVFLQGLLLMNKARAISRVHAIEGWLDHWLAWCENLALSPLQGALSVAKGFGHVDYCLVGVDNISHLREIIEAWNSSNALSAPHLAAHDPNVFDPRRWGN